MTALPDWVDAGRTDAALATAAATGEQAAFAAIYDRYANRLHDFCAGMLRDRDAAADCVQDVFCTAATRLPQLREPEKLRPWLYAMARNEALRHLRARRREQLSEEMPDMASCDAGPDTMAARHELADLISDAAGGLSDRDRAVLELAYRHGLDGSELAAALDVSPAHANVLVFRLRETIERSLGALLVARGAKRRADSCSGLAAILAGWDGDFTILMRKRIARHIESCPSCEEDRRRLAAPAALLGGAPVFIPAPAWLRAQTLHRVQLTCASTGITAGSSTPGRGPGPGRPSDGYAPESTDRRMVTPGDTWVADGASTDSAYRSTREVVAMIGVIVLLTAAALAGLGMAFTFLHHQSANIGPAGLNSTIAQSFSPTTTFVAPVADPAPPPAPSVSATVPTVVVPNAQRVPHVQVLVPSVPTGAPLVVPPSAPPPPPPPPPPPIPLPPPPAISAPPPMVGLLAPPLLPTAIVAPPPPMPTRPIPLPSRPTRPEAPETSASSAPRSAPGLVWPPVAQ